MKSKRGRNIMFSMSFAVVLSVLSCSSGSSGPTLFYGDINGDGYSDLVVGAFLAESNKGKTYVYLGSSAGISTTASATITGSSTNWLGFSVSYAGDMNGDGYADLAVSAPYAGSGSEGLVYLFYGSADGIASCDLSTCTPSIVITGETANSGFGNSLSLAGDINKDGYADLVVGAIGGNGKAYVFHGASNLSTSISAANANTIITGKESANLLGTSVSSSGDINGDGYDDLVVAASEWPSGVKRGQVYIFLGSATGIASCDLSAGCTPNATISGVATDDYLGASVTIGGDLNGDGYDDVLIGSQYAEGYKGRVYIFNGSASGISNCDLSAGCTASSMVTGSAGQYLGYAVYGAGDVNNDGYEDIVVGGWRAGDGGVAIVLNGSASGISCDLSSDCVVGSVAHPGATITGAENYSLGGSVVCAGDVNRDTYSDIAIGAIGANTGTGQAYVFTGSATGISNCNFVTGCMPNTLLSGDATENAFGVVHDIGPDLY